MDRVDRIPIPIGSQIGAATLDIYGNNLVSNRPDKNDAPRTLHDSLEVLITTEDSNENGANDCFHVHTDATVSQNVLKESTATLNDPYLWSKNLKQHAVALKRLENGEVNTKFCSTLFFLTRSTKFLETDVTKAFVYIFPRTALCVKLKISSITQCPNADISGYTYMLTCENVSLDIFPSLQKVFRQIKANEAMNV
uniref:Uncharacterized protein n=1 Tax=Biomphalaria glabrata TaxID=6526 RepID=A0A2C9M017_BIOGL